MDYAKMTVAELKALLTERGIGYPKDFRKSELIELLEQEDEPIEVDAETLGELGERPRFEVSMADVQGDIVALSEKVDIALDAYQEFECGSDGIAKLDAETLRICEDALTDSVNAAEDARKALKRDYNTPIKAAEARYKELMEPVMALRDAYKEHRVQLRRQGLESTYRDFCEANGVPSLPDAVPFQRLLDAHPQWMRRDSNAGKAAQSVEDTAEKLIADWGVLTQQKHSMRFYEQAEMRFFETLDVGEAVRFNAQLVQQAQRAEQARQERDEADAWRVQATVEALLENSPRQGQGRAVATVSGPQAAACGQPMQRRRYHFEAWLNDTELASFREWKNACGIGDGWTFREVKDV